jgi:hypothetical protein
VVDPERGRPRFDAKLCGNLERDTDDSEYLHDLCAGK